MNFYAKQLKILTVKKSTYYDNSYIYKDKVFGDCDEWLNRR